MTVKSEVRLACISATLAVVCTNTRHFATCVAKLVNRWYKEFNSTRSINYFIDREELESAR